MRTRRCTYNVPDDKVIVKFDFANAFNSVRRDALLEAVARDIPALYRFIYATYENCNPILKFGDFVISSAEGVHREKVPTWSSGVLSCHQSSNTFIVIGVICWFP